MANNQYQYGNYSDGLLNNIFSDYDFKGIDFDKYGTDGLSDSLNVDDTFLGMDSSTWNGIGTGLQGLGAIGQGVVGYKALGVAEDQLSLAEDQWDEKKTELNHMRATRSKNNAQYRS